jgi:hypothetical protein
MLGFQPTDLNCIDLGMRRRLCLGWFEIRRWRTLLEASYRRLLRSEFPKPNGLTELSPVLRRGRYAGIEPTTLDNSEGVVELKSPVHNAFSVATQKFSAPR